MAAVTERDTFTVSIMAGTQIVKTELLINVAGYYIHQDPSPILLVQPSQDAAQVFSKERFAPTIEATPVLRSIVLPPRARDSDNTITHKSYPGGSLDFVGANSPTDLSSRPERIILCDEIDKYPPSAGSEGDPLKLAEERASTYRAIGRAKFVRTCSPTTGAPADDQPPISRIAREYLASDQRKCFVPCLHCGHEQILTWAHVRWDRGSAGEHLASTASIVCEECGTAWSERDRRGSLDALRDQPAYGWRQTKEFYCCGEKRRPTLWDERGRARCSVCEAAAPYGGHAGFHLSKLYSRRHNLADVVAEFLEAKDDPELLRKWTNTAIAEVWRPQYGETFDSAGLIARTEPYGPNDLPESVRVVTGFCDVQGDRLEVLFAGWGADEECWCFQYTIINRNPAEPEAWIELDALRATTFKTTTGRLLRISSFGIDAGDGNHAAQVLAYAARRRGQRVFACMGAAGMRPIWPGRASKSKTGRTFYSIGVDTAKDQIYSRLRIDPPEPGVRKPGYIHFPVAENFDPEFFEQLNSERRQVRKRMGQPYTIWVKIRARNEALDCLVGALAMRKALPRYIEAGLEYALNGKCTADGAYRAAGRTGPPAHLPRHQPRRRTGVPAMRLDVKQGHLPGAPFFETALVPRLRKNLLGPNQSHARALCHGPSRGAGTKWRG